MILGSCRTCRFMAAPRSKGEHGTCVRIIHGNGDCETWDDRTADPDKELAYVTDGSGYSARLLVLPSFGCALHELGPSVVQREEKQRT